MNDTINVLNAQITAAINSEITPREDNDLLYPAVAEGDEESIKRMIEINMPFAINRADSFIKVYPDYAYLRDDMVSEGFLGLTTAVRKMAEEGPVAEPNATGYISFWITKAIGTVIEQEQSATGASSRTARRRADAGEELPHQVPMPDPLPLSDDWVDPMSMPDLRDLIYACCETDADRMIVDMREQGHKDKEIARAIDTPVTTTYMLRRAIYARFLEKSGMSGEV